MCTIVQTYYNTLVLQYICTTRKTPFTITECTLGAGRVLSEIFCNAAESAAFLAGPGAGADLSTVHGVSFWKVSSKTLPTKGIWGILPSKEDLFLIRKENQERKKKKQKEIKN